MSERSISYPGLLMVTGGYYAGLAISWLLLPSTGRVAGIDWLRIPDWAVHPTGVAVIWAVGALACFVGAMRPPRSTLERWCGMIAACVSFLLGGLFMGAWLLTFIGHADAPRGIVTAFSYWFPGVLLALGLVRGPAAQHVEGARPRD